MRCFLVLGNTAEVPFHTYSLQSQQLYPETYPFSLLGDYYLPCVIPKFNWAVLLGLISPSLQSQMLAVPMGWSQSFRPIIFLKQKFFVVLGLILYMDLFSSTVSKKLLLQSKLNPYLPLIEPFMDPLLRPLIRDMSTMHVDLWDTEVLQRFLLCMLKSDFQLSIDWSSIINVNFMSFVVSAWFFQPMVCFSFGFYFDRDLSSSIVDSFCLIFSLVSQSFFIYRFFFWQILITSQTIFGLSLTKVLYCPTAGVFSFLNLRYRCYRDQFLANQLTLWLFFLFD